MSGDAIEFDTVLDLCQHEHRRIVLGMLVEEQRSLTLNDLTKAIFKQSHQTPITEASENELTNIRIWLFHVHLPKLTAEGLINHDSERQLVEPTEQFEQLQPRMVTILDTDSSLKARATR